MVGRMSTTMSSATAPEGWLASLARSKAQIAAGETVPLLPVLDRLRATAERLEAAQESSGEGPERSAGG
jgi:hypothetical protein